MAQLNAEALERLGNNRSDFMKRWFAIAISVGFATAVSGMPWLRDNIGLDRHLPVDWSQVRQCGRLVATVIATILSWDGYFQSIERKPLRDGFRFGIDVFLVLLYLLLLLTSKFDYFWLLIHSFSFLIYCVWDYLSMKAYPREYVTKNANPNFHPTPLEIYRGSLRDDEQIYRGPAITLIWPIYFLSLYLSDRIILTPSARELPITTFLYAALVIAGLFTYRHDKKNHFRRPRRLTVITSGVVFAVSISFVLRLVS